MTRLVGLPLRVPHGQHEPAYSVLDRLALRHGEKSAVDFISQLASLRRAAPSKILSSVRAGHYIDEIAALSRIPAEMLRSNTLSYLPNTSENERLRDLAVPSILIGGAVGRVCPECIRSDLSHSEQRVSTRPFRRFWWDLKQIDVCPKHRIPLLARCPICDCRLAPRRISPRFCCCGADFATFRLPKLSKERTLADAYFVERITKSADHRNCITDHMPLEIAKSAMLRIGLAASGVERKPVKELAWSERAEFASIGFEALMNTSTKLVGILDQLISRREETRAPKVTSYYGSLYIWLARSKHASLEPLRELVKRHIGASFPHCREQGIFGDTALFNGTVTLGSSARFLGIGHGRAKSMIDHSGVSLIRGAGRMSELAVAELHQISNRLGEYMDMQSCLAALHIPRGSFRALIEQGLVEKIQTSSRETRPLFSRSSIERLLNVLNRSLPCIEECTSEQVELLKAAQPSISIAQLIAAVVNGRLCPVAHMRSANGLAAIVILRTDILNAARVSGSLTGIEIAQRLGIPLKAMRSAISFGLIVPDSDRGIKSIAGRSFSSAKLEAFRAKYTTAWELSRAVPNMSARHISDRLRMKGIKPIISGRGKGTWYERSDALKSLSDTLHPGPES